MKASVVELRKDLKSVQRALRRNEPVTLLNHGKVFGVIHPAADISSEKPAKVSAHPFFNSRPKSTQSVEDVMHDLRKPRYDAI